jgi:hypothetical protein
MYNKLKNMKTRKGIIKISPYRFQPVVVTEDHPATDVCIKQKDFAYNNINMEVEFYIDENDYAIIKNKK